jgi:hypothetical protein
MLKHVIEDLDMLYYAICDSAFYQEMVTCELYEIPSKSAIHWLKEAMLDVDYDETDSSIDICGRTKKGSYWWLRLCEVNNQVS